MLSAKEEILDRLREARFGGIPKRIDLPPAYELSYSREKLIENFTAKVAAQTGVVHRVENTGGILAKLPEIFLQEGVKKAVVSEDEILAPLNLPEWGRQQGIEIASQKDFPDRASFKEAVFHWADAGITGADFAVAESGTLALVHDLNQARLLSLAPVLHIAVVSVENVVPVYENVIDAVYGQGDFPSQTSFITGPSMTADIQGIPFKGMHGPRRLTVILVG